MTDVYDNYMSIKCISDTLLAKGIQIKPNFILFQVGRPDSSMIKEHTTSSFTSFPLCFFTACYQFEAKMPLKSSSNETELVCGIIQKLLLL